MIAFFLLIFLIVNILFSLFTFTVFSLNYNASNISIRASTDRNDYTNQLKILVYVNFPTNNKDIRKVVLEEYNAKGELIYNESQITNQAFNQFIVFPRDIGTHLLKITGIYNKNEETTTLHFDVVNTYFTNTAIFLYFSFAFFIALIILIIFSKGNNIIEEILRLVFLSGIVVSLLLSLLFTDMEFGLNSPIGLIKIPGDLSNFNGGGGWFGNVGGIITSEHKVIGGLQIPVYVIIFGLIGGYIRYLYKTSKLFIDDRIKEENEKIRQNIEANNPSQDTNPVTIYRKMIFFQSLKDITLFVLSPLLAIVVWFLFSQWMPINNSPYLLATFSFATGLTTTEIINTVTNFTISNLDKRTK